MNHCLETNDLRVIGDSIFAAFDTRVAAIPVDLCAPFREEARQLEAELMMIYKMTVVMARNVETVEVDDLEVVANIWTNMVIICDRASAKLSELTKQHPYCGANDYFDRVLDLRNKCHRLTLMHS